ncbi:hypothetical protein LTR62_006008 [Meristemomyces frigidus]|uniref:Uncharacterized protein n=1 Tax=Meristemomyces frigidus TaxID=1508187 RepID=A0AAN7TIU8_9PEZI|nr:hypothetical protein LTR62_006008 [Meristemomyces frigidus]
MVSSLVPPKVASPNAIGGAADAARMQRVVSFYEKLPRGPAPTPKARGPLEWYSLRYMSGRNPSVMPIVHIVGAFIALGYAQNYYFHLPSETVMAEQIGHNVVDNTQSAGASAPTDVAMNQINTDLADSGNVTTSEPRTSDILDDTKIANDFATSMNGSVNPDQVDRGTIEMNGAHDAASQVGSQDESGSVELSVTSDAEGKSTGLGQKKGDSHHVRSNSVKKPTTFSKVSVTKSFLAKSASPVLVTSTRLGDKQSTLAAPQQPVARPRLVAKTASSGQGVSRPRVGTESAGLPDASKVWNKNRPVAPPPPKHFTDEELKQQYGIHLATRLQTDENGKESKWADIDEDEEDWVPETVEWMDGTKSTLAPSEAVVLEEKQQAAQAAIQQQQKPAEPTRPVLALKKTELGPQKTILKPGNAAKQAAQTLRSATGSPAGDKPQLKAKDTSGTPARSPWAQLPPVEAIPLINPPVQDTRPRALALPSQDARAYNQDIPPPPAREIAADTFRRFGPEGQNAPQQLFNSANGQYEPAPEGRRSSMRQDPSIRKPSLLQRPSQSGQGPAEPSPAFQTRSSSNTDGPPSWAARRRGSNVSQGSGFSGRRMSVSRPSELPPAFEEDRRSSDGSGLTNQVGAPALHRDGTGRPQFSQQNAWDQQMPPKPQPGAEVDDPVKIQERIMREKRDVARKRREEDSARESKEKEERLKARLATLEGAGKSRKEREAEAVAKAAEKKAALEKPAEPPRKAASPTPDKDVSVKAGPTATNQGATMESSLTVQSAAKEEKAPSPLPQKMSQPTNLPTRPATEPQAEAPRAHLSPRAHSRVPASQQPPPYRSPATTYSSPGDRKVQPFGRSSLANDTFSAIPGWNTSAPNGNVWGSSGIGNGTFDKSSAYALMPMSQQNSTLLPPPGMGRPSSNNRVSPPSRSQESQLPGLASSQAPEQQRGFPPPGIESRPENTWGASRHNGTSPASGLGRQTNLPAPIAPPSRAQLQQQQPQQREAAAAWQHAAQTLPNQFTADAGTAARKQQQGQQQDTAPAPVYGTIKETFKKTSSEQGKLGGPRRFESTEYTIHDQQGSRSVSALSPAPPSTQTQPSGPVPTSSPLGQSYIQGVENTVRIPDGSRNPAHGGTDMQQPPLAPANVRQQPLTAYHGNVNFIAGPLPGVLSGPMKDASPPPPETSKHPVYGQDMGHPTVRLPRAAPRVKLPPALAATTSPDQQPQNITQVPGRPVQWGPPGVARPLVQNNEWQARFNGLFNRAHVQTEVPPSPPGTPPKSAGSVAALAITSSTRAEMDDALESLSAKISLPTSPPRRTATADGFTVDDRCNVVSKPSIDDMFNEELSFGSLPIVRVPRGARYSSAHLRAPRQSMLSAIRPSERATSQSTESLPPHFWPRNTQGIFVKLPGSRLGNRLVRFAATSDTKTRTFSNRRGGGQAGRGGRDMKSGNHKASGTDTPTPSMTPNVSSRSTSFQRGQAPTVPAAESPSTPVRDSGSPAATNSNAERVARRGRGAHSGAMRARGGHTGPPVIKS